jgi:hypothetical protein
MSEAVTINMVLYCPACGVQHIDEPSEGWDNPPHRSHLCHGCGCIWRPADVATNGVADIKTEGSADTWVTYPVEVSASPALSPALLGECREVLEPHVFLDCDGVLADFDTYAEAYFGMEPRAYEAKVGSAQFWQELEAKGDFYRNLPLMPDAMDLYEAVKHLHPTILTGCPRGNWAQGQKVAWAAEHFPGVPIITCRSADKRDYAKPGDVLIDDWAQHRHRWIEMGGVFITHHDAASSIAALWAHYPLLAKLPEVAK